MFGFPLAPREENFKLEQNLLKSAIFQLKFQPHDNVINKKEELQKILSHDFPIVEDVVRSAAEIKFESDKTPILESTQSQADGFKFHTEDRFKSITITKDSLTLNIAGKIYLNFSDSIQTFKELIFPILSELEIKIFNRVAIRKINLVESTQPGKNPPSYTYPSIFENTLVSNFLSFPPINSLESGISTMTFNLGGYKLNLSYGILKNPIKGHPEEQILLDIDLYKINSETDFSKLEEELNLINQEIFNIFTWALNKNLIFSLTSDPKG